MVAINAGLAAPKARVAFVGVTVSVAGVTAKGALFETVVKVGLVGRGEDGVESVTADRQNLARAYGSCAATGWGEGIEE